MMNEAPFLWHREVKIIPPPSGLRVWRTYEDDEGKKVVDGPYLVLAIAVGLTGAIHPGTVDSIQTIRYRKDGTEVKQTVPRAERATVFDTADFEGQVVGLENAPVLFLLAGEFGDPWFRFDEVLFTGV